MSVSALRRGIAVAGVTVSAAGLMLAAATASQAATSNVPTSCANIHYSDSGTCVKEVQGALEKNGYPSLAADGGFGPATLGSVVSWQSRHSFTATGQVSSAMITALDAGKAATSTPSKPNVAAFTAAYNAGKTAGTCARPATRNSSGGDSYGTSCVNGVAQAWCADFVKWLYGTAGITTSPLTPLASSARTYGIDHATLHTAASYNPHLGDLIIFAQHVGIVIGTEADGHVTVANGDFAVGRFNPSTSNVQIDRISAANVGQDPGWSTGAITGYVSPAR